jgi:hypothetical protein
MNSLLDKFKTVQVTDESLLPAIVVTPCKFHQRYFDVTLKQLEVERDKLKILFDAEQAAAAAETDDAPVKRELEKSNWYDDKRFKMKKPYKSNNDKSHTYPYRAFRFSYGYAYTDCLNLIDKLRIYFCNRITGTIRELYNIKLDDIKKDEAVSGKFDTYQDVIRWVKAKVGSLDFGGKAIDEWKEKFRNKIYWKNYVKVKGKLMDIDNFMRYESYSSPTKFEWGGEDNCLVTLSAAISIFETGEYKARYEYQSMSNTPVDFGNEYPTINSKKVESIRCYKNHKIQIKFATPQLAQDFFNLFDLGNFKER